MAAASLMKVLEMNTPTTPAQAAIPKWIDDPHDIEQGMMLNPAWLKANNTTVSAIAAQAAQPEKMLIDNPQFMTSKEGWTTQPAQREGCDYVVEASKLCRKCRQVHQAAQPAQPTDAERLDWLIEEGFLIAAEKYDDTYLYLRDLDVPEDGVRIRRFITSDPRKAIDQAITASKGGAA